MSEERAGSRYKHGACGKATLAIREAASWHGANVQRIISVAWVGRYRYVN